MSEIVVLDLVSLLTSHLWVGQLWRGEAGLERKRGMEGDMERGQKEEGERGAEGERKGRRNGQSERERERENERARGSERVRGREGERGRGGHLHWDAPIEEVSHQHPVVHLLPSHQRQGSGGSCSDLEAGELLELSVSTQCTYKRLQRCIPGVALSPEVPEIGLHMNARLRVHKHSIQTRKGYLAHKETVNPPWTTIRP